ncbi:MAG: rhodanese-like domain-containing protein [Pseudomonadota bacterium]
MVRWAVYTVVLAFAFVVPGVEAGPERLADIDTKLRRQYPGLDHIDAESLAAKLSAGAPVLLLDARSQREFDAGHLPGAIRVSPRAVSRAVTALVGNRARGAEIVMYCSVGVRSARLANRIESTLTTAGATRVANLEGGIFNWHNNGRPIMTTDGATDTVHPYNRAWGQMLRAPVKVGDEG